MGTDGDSQDDDGDGSSLYSVGVIGVASVSLLLIIAVRQLFLLMRRSKEDKEFSRSEMMKSEQVEETRKKFAFHALIVASLAMDLPMYIGFIVVKEVQEDCYAVHQLCHSLLFCAFSIMIRDWSKALIDINEVGVSSFLFSKWSLIVINVCYLSLSLFSCIYLLVMKDLDSFVASPVYTILLFFQIFISFILSGMMLYSGLKLMNKIQGAVRITDAGWDRGTEATSHGMEASMAYEEEVSEYGRVPSRSLASLNDDFKSSGKQSLLVSSSHSHGDPRITSTASSSPFQRALQTLNLVMATQMFCIIVQILFLILDYALGYSQDEDKTYGPAVLYWTFYAWVPQWGIVCSLLYLARTESRNSPPQHGQYQHSRSGTGSINMNCDVSVTFSQDEEVAAAYASTDHFSQNSIHASGATGGISHCVGSPTRSEKQERGSSISHHSAIVDLDISLRTRPSESPYKSHMPVGLLTIDDDDDDDDLLSREGSRKESRDTKSPSSSRNKSKNSSGRHNFSTDGSGLVSPVSMTTRNLSVSTTATDNEFQPHTIARFEQDPDNSMLYVDASEGPAGTVMRSVAGHDVLAAEVVDDADVTASSRRGERMEQEGKASLSFRQSEFDRVSLSSEK